MKKLIGIIVFVYIWYVAFFDVTNPLSEVLYRTILLLLPIGLAAFFIAYLLLYIIGLGYLLSGVTDAFKIVKDKASR